MGTVDESTQTQAQKAIEERAEPLDHSLLFLAVPAIAGRA
jgi:hypothetical protein